MLYTYMYFARVTSFNQECRTLTEKWNACSHFHKEGNACLPQFPPRQIRILAAHNPFQCYFSSSISSMPMPEAEETMKKTCPFIRYSL